MKGKKVVFLLLAFAAAALSWRSSQSHASFQSSSGRYIAIERQTSTGSHVLLYYIYNLDIKPESKLVAALANAQSPAVNAAGTMIAFHSLVGNHADIFLHDVVSGTTRNVTNSPGADEKFPSLSGDGRFLSYSVYYPHGFVVYDLQGQRVVLHIRGSTLPVISCLDGNGSHVAHHWAAPLGPRNYVVLREVATGRIVYSFALPKGHARQPYPNDPSFSQPGGSDVPDLIAHFQVGKDINDQVRHGIYVRLVANNSDELISEGDAQHPAISLDGRYVAYAKDGDIFLFDRVSRSPVNLPAGLNTQDFETWPSIR
ncbi:MAG: hypothetical protein NZ959_05360 [Armatimonadetes bacterium]|nr:hypothetical protein [Armatimonadota bacterium]MDW8122953.1 hypothetical protein [Armatimonadota bacterium]